MDPSYVDLHRDFIHYDPNEDSEAAATRSYIDRQLGGDQTLTWDTLFSHGRCVILGEPGSGKTWEFKAALERQLEKGLYAFLLNLEGLVEDGIEKQFDQKQLADYSAWKKGTETAYFLLDSRDEAAIKNYRGFENAIRRFARDIGPMMGRVSVIISSRIVAWRGAADEDVLIRHLPQPKLQTREIENHEDGSDAKRDEEAPRIVRLNALSPKQTTLLARSLVDDAEEFIEAVNQGHAWNFARRPIDVIGLVNYWRIYGDLGTLKKIVEFDTTNKLAETGERRREADPLSRANAKAGAKALALSAALCRSFTFEHVTEGHTVNFDEARINPHAVLPHWTSFEISSLQGRPLFDPAAFNSVRFHHRDSLDFLAAECIRDLYDKHLTYSQLRNLLIVESQGHRIVPESLRAITAWIARDLPELRKELIHNDPDILLDHGDPTFLPLEERIVLLNNIALREERRLQSVDPAQLRRIADAGLIPTINTLILNSATNEDVRRLLFRLISEANFARCAPAVLSISLSNFETTDIRLQAMRTLFAVGESSHLQMLAKGLLSRQTLSANEASMACRILYPGTISIRDMETLIRRITSPASWSDSWMQFGFEEKINSHPPESLSSLMRMFIRLSRARPWIPSPEQGKVTGVSEKNMWVRRPLIATLKRLMELEALGGLSPWEVADAIDQMSNIQRHGISASKGQQDLDKALDRHPDVRRKLFWLRVNRLKLRKRPANISRFDVDHYDDLGRIRAEDIEWLLKDAETAPSAEDQIIAYKVSTGLWWDSRSASTIPRHRLKATARSNPSLRPIFQAEVPNRLSVSWTRARWRLRHLRHSSMPYKLIFEYRKLRDYLRVLKQCIFNFRNLIHGRSLPILRNVLVVANDGRINTRYGEFDFNIVDGLYGKWIGRAIRKGFRATWRHYRPPSPGHALNMNYTYSPVSLIGLNLEFSNGIELDSLSVDEAKTAASHALYELNGFPLWIDELAKAHPNSVREVFSEQLEQEFTLPSDAESPYGLIHDLASHGSDVILPLCVPTATELLRRGDPLNLIVLSFVLELLAKSGSGYRSELNDLCPTRASAAWTATDNSRLLIWLSLWLQLDALPAIDFLEGHILPGSTSALDQEKFVVQLASALRGEKRMGLTLPNPNFKSAPALERLIPLLYQHVRPSDDQHHDGAYSPNERDDAQDFRSSTLQFLVESEDEGAYAALMSIANNPHLSHLRNRLLSYAVERAKKDAEKAAWRPEDVATFIERYEKPPRNANELFELVIDRLNELRDDWENGDFSMAGMFKENEKEEVFQKAVAARLDDASRDVYQVAREVEVFDHKLPDIRIFRTDAGIVTIEIKVANKSSYSYSYFVDEALKAQLLEKYMRYRRSKHGILVLVNLEKDRKWRPPGRSNIGLEDVVNSLNEEAAKLVRHRERNEKVRVIGIDLS